MRAHVRGAAEMLRPGDIILIGEVHGSSEIPAVVGALMSEALACGLHVELGLEMELSPTERSRMDTFLASDGGAAARAALLRGEHWRFEDGRASKAVLELVEQARAARVPLFAIDEAVADVRGGPLHAAAMSANVLSAVARAPRNALVLVLSGSAHSRVDVSCSMGGQVKNAHPCRTRSLVVGHAGGTVFAFHTIDGFPVHGPAALPRFRPGHSLPRMTELPCVELWHTSSSAIMNSVAEAFRARYDGCIHVGHLSPSAPARRPACGTDVSENDSTRFRRDTRRRGPCRMS